MKVQNWKLIENWLGQRKLIFPRCQLGVKHKEWYLRYILQAEITDFDMIYTDFKQVDTLVLYNLT